MSASTTENISLNKPASGSTTWSEEVNTNWDTLDSEVSGVKSDLQSYKTSNMGLVELSLSDGSGTAYCFGRTS